MSGHAQHPWYKRYPSDFLAGTRGMRPILHKLYSRLVDGMYEYGGPLPCDVLRLKHLLEVRPRDLPRLLDELAALGKIEVIDGFIHNKRTDDELGKMNGQNANIEPTQAQHSLNIGSTEPQHEPNIKRYRGKKRSKNFARTRDPARDHAHARTEAEENKALPAAESFIHAAAASGALPPREDAAVASLGLEGRALAPHPAQAEPGKGLMAALDIPSEPEMTEEERAQGLKRFAEWGASLKPQQPVREPVPLDALGVPVSRLMAKLKAAKENGHDDAQGADGASGADRGGDQRDQGEVPKPEGAAAAKPGATGLYAALGFGTRGDQGEEGEED